MFSVDFSKYISAIKSTIRALLKLTDSSQDPAVFLDQIFEKRGTYGNTGYRLRTELTSELDEVTKETSEPETISDTPASDTMARGVRRYLKYNWMPLFVYVFLVLGIVLLLDSLNISAEVLMRKVLDIPFGFTFIALIIMSALPVLAGLLIDVPVALKEYEKKKGIKKDGLGTDYIHKVVMYIIPRFDNSKAHIIFFLACNLTGAFTVSSILLYVKSIPGISDSLAGINHGCAYAIIIFAGCLVALFNNFSLQTTESGNRCSDNYILSRAHAFLNLLFLSVSLSFGSSLIYTFLSFRLFYSKDSVVITSAYIVMVLSAYCYLWFSSDSPAAQRIDSISKNNFITGLPVAVVITTVYTILCFTPDLNCFLSLLISPLFLILWFVCFLRRRKTNTIKLYYFVSSFFSIMAVSVIFMLLLNFWI